MWYLGYICSWFFDINEGVFYGGNGKQIGVQLMGIIVISLWTSFMSFCLFYLLNKFKLLRISKEEEIMGIDWVEHGGKAYHINDDNNDIVINENNNLEMFQYQMFNFFKIIIRYF